MMYIFICIYSCMYFDILYDIHVHMYLHACTCYHEYFMIYICICVPVYIIMSDLWMSAYMHIVNACEVRVSLWCIIT